MAIHIGKKIREELYKQNISVIDFGSRINRSRNVVYDIFERESIDTALLHKIGKELRVDFFSIYSIQKEYSYVNTKSFVVNESNMLYGKIQNEELKNLQKQIELLQTEISYLKKINSLLENKRPAKKPAKKTSKIKSKKK
ncbi:MAG TPA: hypothetical protein VGP43_09845 [Chitinophagaceae bacterium]|nr:hypothetical protein [Bacteroidota bacterium]HEV8081005.1 hypothetical protein [Chitinophagaceae bacterium]